MLESAQVGMVEVTLAPRSSLAGVVLRQLHFRERFGLQVLAIWRGGRAYRSNLRDMKLEFGDAFLALRVAPHGHNSRLLGRQPLGQSLVQPLGHDPQIARR